MRTRFTIALLGTALALGACGTPQEQCISSATSEVRKLDKMIAESSANLARGYAIEEQTIVTRDWVPCLVRGTGVNGVPPQTTMCFEPEEETIRRNVPIDPVTEGRTLANLKARRAALAKPVDAAIRQCRIAYPE